MTAAMVLDDEPEDQLGAALAACEKAIARIGLGVEAGVPFVVDGVEIGRLVWGKRGSRWLLLVERTSDPGTVHPLLKSNRRTRIAAPEHLESLVAALEAERDRMDRALGAAVEKALGFVKWVGATYEVEP